ncbi:mandelate racemase/muconate lactonizing enzyme family protein [Pontivivens insulae]|uniref:D-galactonate dehydratase n=1 Tax=Pontivivens insulae TaxID=1639689 RepID=A0A2R8AFP9_9RHOB|nr:mandelate racemase/muconate lactonizing enzyme family protein [Pontivivens insulae]RED12292.1 L-alanine-DL-glutamate epimerase-like enolase superfamily enzyme [Pontivivens insulae]SPF31049.1 D-galactonate dehydratase [Pontivivens insulae]
MKLDAVEIFTVGNPPPGYGGRYFLLVKVHTDTGLHGWGECYAAAVGPTAMHAVIEDVFNRHMRGCDPAEIEKMFRRVHSSGFTQRPDPTVMGAFSGLEMACWDIRGKALNQPVHALLGGRVQERVRAYTYLYPMEGEDPAGFYNSPQRSAQAASEWIERGFTALKFDPAGPYTIMGGHQPSQYDLDRSEAFCREIRKAVGARADLLFGTHGQFTPDAAIRMGRRLEAYDPLWFEEPCPPDMSGDLAKVAQAVRVPIATGERLTTKYEFAHVLRSGAASILQPALGRVGGLWEAKKIAAMAEGFGAQLAPHLYAGPVEWAANIQLALSCPNFLIAETIGEGLGFQADLLVEPIRVERGHIIPPSGPGMGIDINEDVLKAHPYKGDRLHLEMQDRPLRYDGEERFAGG